MGVISDEDVAMLKSNESKLMQKIDLEGSTVLNELRASGTLTDTQVHIIEAQQGNDKKVGQMLEYLRIGTTDTVRNLRAALYASAQASVAEDYLGLMPVYLGEQERAMKPAVGYGTAGLAILGDCVCVTAWKQPVLWLRNNTTDTSKLYPVDGLQATGMAAVDNDTLVITDYSKKLHFIAINQQDMGIISHTVVDIPFEANGVSVDAKTGKVILTNKSGKQIVTCDRSGKIERSLPVAGVGSMWCAVAIGDAYVVLDGSDSGGLYWVSKEGKITNTLNGQWHGKRLRYARHMVLDSDGRLIVADEGNNRLLHISPDRMTTESLLTEEDHPDDMPPLWVGLDKSAGRLYVVCSNRLLHEYKWPSTTYKLHA